MKNRLLLLFAALLTLNFVSCKEQEVDGGETPEETPIPTSIIGGIYIGEFSYEISEETQKQYKPYDQTFTITVTNDSTATMDMSNIYALNKSLPDLRITRDGDKFVLSETTELMVNNRKMEIVKMEISGTTSRTISMVIQTSYRHGMGTDEDPHVYKNEHRVSVEAKSMDKDIQAFVSAIKWTDDPSEIVIGDTKVENKKEGIQMKDDQYYGMVKYSGTITYYTMPNPTTEQLQGLKGEFLITQGATQVVRSMKPDWSGFYDYADFSSSLITCSVVSKDSLSYMEYQVVRADGAALSGKDKTYNFSSLDWNKIGKDPDANMNYYEPKDWATSNSGIHSIKSMFPSYYAKDKPFVVTQGPKAEAFGGTGLCAKLQTAMTNPEGTGSMIPKVTAGSMFFGTFETNLTDILASTKFGIIYKGTKLTSVKGKYKYTPGTEFWNSLELDKTGKQDKGSAAAVLYEVSNYSETLTGKDLHTSPKIVAVATAVFGTQADYTDFTLTMEYKKTYDPAKKYKLAVVFSSSIEGDKYFGAVGSTLWVDSVVIDME